MIFDMKLFALALIVAMLGLPLPAGDVVPDPFPPAKFTSLYIEKDEKGKIMSVQLTGDDVVFKCVIDGKEIDSATVHPSGDDWFQFIQALNLAKVYKWSPNYTYPGQGITWVIDLATENRKLTSGGTNEFPKEGAEDQPQADPNAGPSTSFQIVWQAAMALVGKDKPPGAVK
jgi:hypothetical protein